MKRLIIIAAFFLSLSFIGNAQNETQTFMHYYIDEHDIGSGKVQFKDAAIAHEKDLETEQKFHVKFIKYWVNEKEGKIYCLSQAPDPHSIYMTHKEAHGLVPNRILEVTRGEKARLLNEDQQLFLDIHHFSPGSVTPKAVAQAHEKDLAVQEKYGVHFINYWVDEQNGIVMCLSASPDARAIINTHKEAHGLLPDKVMDVQEGK